MEHVKYREVDELAVIELARGKANAMNDRMVDEIAIAVRQAAASGTVHAVVLASNRPRFFSAGFDVMEVFRYDRETMTDFFGRYIDLYTAIYHLSKPVVAALSGHAYAGGAILALACDFRVMASRDAGFAFNEINFGAALPPGIIGMAINAVGPAHARELLFNGDTITPERALEIGLAAELAPADQVIQRAIARAGVLASKPSSAFSLMKRWMLASCGSTGASDDSDRRYLTEFIDQWFSPDAEVRKQALVESLQK